MKVHKDMTNGELAELLRAVAASYQIENEQKNKFKVIAYNRAADAIEHLGTEAKDIWDEGNLKDVSGIGPSIAEHLGEIFETGESKHFEKILKGVPKAALVLLEIGGIGPKKAYRLARELNLPDKGTLDALKKLAQKGEIAKMEGFGEESQSGILRALEEFKQKAPARMLLSEAESYAEEIIHWLGQSNEAKRVDMLGSLRRKAPTVGDVDLSVASDNPGKIIELFVEYPKKIRVINRGEKSASLLLPGNVRADLKVESPKTYGALLQHFTGSKHHNVALREYALKKGMSLSEHGIKPLRGKIQNEGLKSQNYNSKLKIYEFSNEEDFYGALGMDYIPPELREGGGEIEAALTHNLPELVEMKDIKGDLQIHSDYDIETSHDVGASSMEELVAKAKSLNYEYIAFTEHNPSQRNHNMKQIVDILKRKKEKVARVNSGEKKFRVFNSLEIDILPDGRLPVSDEALNTLDFALVSIHSSFKKSREEMTKRVLDGLSRPRVKIFAHPTARMLESREGVELNWDEIFNFCLKNDKWIEINADPHRLDLPDFLIRDAVKAGVKLTLGTDAHHEDGMDNMRYGVAMARRGWAEKGDIINSLTLTQIERLLK